MSICVHLEGLVAAQTTAAKRAPTKHINAGVHIRRPLARVGTGTLREHSAGNDTCIYMRGGST